MHTREQAPKKAYEQGRTTPMQPERPLSQWVPTRHGYLTFLAESRTVYDCLEQLVAAESSAPWMSRFVDTGLERREALDKDLAALSAEWGVELPALAINGPGTMYAAYLRAIAADNPPAFLCHFYNTYFAHTAGGRMIGRKVSEMILDGKELNFYQWKWDVTELMTAVRTSIDEVATEWPRDAKDACLDETALSFKYSGELLKTITLPEP